MNGPTIAITRGLLGSDTDYKEVSVDAIEDYLTTHTNCYERTLPLTKDIGTKAEPHRIVEREGANRAYVDLDGFAGEMSETEFNDLVETIIAKLTFGISEPIAMMEASEYGYKKKQFIHKLSFRLLYTKKHGSKNAIKQYITTDVLPLLQTLLAEDIKVSLDCDCEGDKYLGVDMGVYNPLGRKMRMWNSSKDNENRPNRLVGDATLLDTLITYIPAESEALPEPVEEVKTTKKKKEVAETSTTGSGETGNPSDDLVVVPDTDILTRVIMGLGPKRFNTYDYFIKVGMACFNEGLPMKVWEDFAKQSPKYNGRCAKDWAGFKKGNLTQATLWSWLKEDNAVLFAELCPQRTDFWELIKNPNHAETARYFYNAKPDAYVYHETLGWFQLLPSNAWKHYENKKEPSGLMLDINMTLKKALKEHWATIDPSSQDEGVKAKIKQCASFGQMIGNKSYVDGVCAFLPSIYNDDELEKKMDESRNLFAFADKVIDLEANETRDIRPSDYICLHTGYKFPTASNAAVRKELMKVLMSIWEDKKVVQYVLQVIASNLHGRKRFEEFYVWTGRGGNGKGLISEMIKRAYGEYYHSIPNDCLTKRSDKKDAPNPPIARAKGKRFVQAQEPEGEEKLQVGTIKEYTGGDEITARALYSNPVKYVPQFGLFLQCNTIPKLSAIDGGIKRRMVIIRFPFQFVETPTESHHRPINMDLKDKICKSDEWRDEFMLMLHETYKTIGASIEKPKWVLEATNEYMAENDAVKGWLEEHYEVGKPEEKKYKLPMSELLEHFLHATNTRADAMTPSTFKRLMEMNGVSQKTETNSFTAPVWDEEEGKYINKMRKSGSYYMFLERKRE
jgi:P4 family phage/plasmid primase-like protien